MVETASDPHKALRDDVRLLGELLGETLRRQEGQRLFDRVERVRALAKRGRNASPSTALRADGDQDGFEALAEELRTMPVASALPIARSFAQFLNLANVAEQYPSRPPPPRLPARPAGAAAAGVDRGGAAAPALVRRSRPRRCIAPSATSASSW